MRTDHPTSRRARLTPVLATALALSGVMLSCDLSPPITQAQADRGPELIAPFKRELMGALTAALGAGGPVEAIEVCRLEAPAIAEGQSAPGVRMGRSSHRLRNPDNAPSEWVSPILNSYLDNPANREPRAVRLSADRIGYIEPITLMPMCLPCHGRHIDLAVQAKLTELYPNDQATGFEAGEFRGVFWVEYPAE